VGGDEIGAGGPPPGPGPPERRLATTAPTDPATRSSEPMSRAPSPFDDGDVDGSTAAGGIQPRACPSYHRLAVQ